MKPLEKVYQDALIALNRRQWPDAERLFKKFLKKEPRHVGALNLLTVVLMSTERFAEAEKFIALAVKLNGKSDASFHNYGLISKRLGKLEQARDQFSNALALNPAAFETWNSRGTVFNDLQQYELALADFERAISINPNYAEAYANKGRSLSALQRHDDALAACERALALKPDMAEAWVGRYRLLSEIGRDDEALAACERALALRPDFAEAWLGRGKVLAELKRYEEARASYDKALALKPDLVEAWLGRGKIFGELECHDDALASFDKALALKPDFAEAWLGRGNVCAGLKRHEEALAAYDRALAVRSGLGEAWLGRGHVFADLKRHDEALASYDEALALKPDFAEAWLGRGNVLGDLRRCDEAFAAYEHAQRLKPDLGEAYLDEAFLRLLLGDTERGWERYEYRWKTRQASAWKRKIPQPLWRGDVSLADKTILLYAEQGLGDTLQFCRYVPLVAARGAHVIVQVQEPLRALMQDLAGAAAVIGAGDPLPDCDLQCPLLSLPLAFRTRLDSIPAQTPYLAAPAGAVPAWAARLEPYRRPRIGLAWSGNASNKADRDRSIALAKLLPLLDIDADFVSLQKDVRPADAAVLAQRNDIRDFTDALGSFSDTAALMAQLDLVITVDTSVAHLAGALAKPFWLLLPDVPDWRWLLDRPDSPWYPSARLFRQGTAGDWDGVIACVRQAARAFVAGVPARDSVPHA